MNFTRAEIIKVITDAAALRLGKSTKLDVKLIARSRGDEVTVTAEVEEAK